MIGKKLLISQIYISYLFHLNLHTLIISAQNSFIYPIVNVPNFSDVILFNKDCKAIKNLTFEELSETLLLHAKVPLINKYVIVNNQAYDIRNMSFLIHTKEGLEPNTFLHFYWMTQYINEPDLEKRYKIYVDYFSDFLQEYKVLHNTYNRKKSKAAQR